MNYIASPTEIALETHTSTMVGVLRINYEQQFITPYGFFFPAQTRANSIIRALRGDCKLKDLIADVDSSLRVAGTMVDHLAQVHLLIFEGDENIITQYQITTGFVTQNKPFRGMPLDANTETLNMLLDDCKDMEEAVFARYNSFAPRNMIDYVILKVEDLAKRLKETGNTKIFALTEFADLK